MPTPTIGITTGRSFDEDGYPRLVLWEAYSQAVQAAGGLPFPIPPSLTTYQIEALLPALDGVLFSGGGDFDPSCYGSLPHPQVAGVDHDRDRLELELFRQATQREIPVLGICRGLQLFNVALGGTLYEDLPDQFSQAILHDQADDHPRDYPAHPVELTVGSRLAEVLYVPNTPVNSLHHQGIRELASSLAASAYSPDNLIEAVEMPGYPFGLAVQWHPECLPDASPMQRLFRAFLDAAGKWSHR
jgi:putative glutamine amidotransferase